ncbi:MAG TPA: hypothetical protein VK177_19840 [Flavobacteriales bacterium]|nr:hypothetical protein [Flavobacteriales bacterium]
MRKFFFASVILMAAVCFVECKSMAKAAARYWTKQQIKEFKSKCNNAAKNNKLISNASDFCDCATDKLSEQYHNYKDAEKLSALEIVSKALDCRENSK